MDIAIVGGGICGLYAAWKLAQKGHNINVFEKKNEIGQKVCSGLFSERILKFIPESRNLIQNRINFALINFPKKTIKLKFSKDFLVMSHFELDKIMAKKAEDSGVKIILNHNVSSIPQRFDKIIGCGGVNSFVRKELGIKNPYFRLAMQGFTEKPEKECLSNFVETWPCENGFIWKIPRGGEIEYGIITEPEKAKKNFDSFLKNNKIVLKEINSKLVAQDFLMPKNPKITLCGEAVGLTKPWSGGGVIWSLKAADILSDVFPDFLLYNRKMRKFFLPKIVLGKTAVRAVYFFGFRTPWIIPKTIKIESDYLL